MQVLCLKVQHGAVLGHVPEVASGHLLDGLQEVVQGSAPLHPASSHPS